MYKSERGKTKLHDAKPYDRPTGSRASSSKLNPNDSDLDRSASPRRKLREKKTIDYFPKSEMDHKEFGVNPNFEKEVMEYNIVRAKSFSSTVAKNPVGTVVTTRKELSGSIANSFLSASGVPSKHSTFWVEIQNTPPGKKATSYTLPYYVKTGSDGALYQGRVQNKEIVGYHGKGEGNYTNLVAALEPIEKKEGTKYVNDNLMRAFLHVPMQAKEEHLATLHEFAMIQRYEDARTKFASGQRVANEKRTSAKLHLREQMMSNKSIASRYSVGGTFKGVESAESLRNAAPKNAGKTAEKWKTRKSTLTG